MRPQPSPSDKWISNENSDLNEELIKPVQNCLSTQTGSILSQKRERENEKQHEHGKYISRDSACS